MVVDANSGAVLHNRAGDEKVYPASLTKMMTIYMAFELIELGRLSYDSKIKMTQEGADAAPSKLDLEPGEELTVLRRHQGARHQVGQRRRHGARHAHRRQRRLTSPA